MIFTVFREVGSNVIIFQQVKQQFQGILILALGRQVNDLSTLALDGRNRPRILMLHVKVFVFDRNDPIGKSWFREFQKSITL